MGPGNSLRHLLHHTSGLPGYIHFFSSSEGISEFTREIAGVTNEAVLERAMDLAGPEFPLGAQYAYGGTGYVLLAMIVAIVFRSIIRRLPKSQRGRCGCMAGRRTRVTDHGAECFA
jgi:CubicO group peptidase (beta-lactamase class C family)